MVGKAGGHNDHLQRTGKDIGQSPGMPKTASVQGRIEASVSCTLEELWNQVPGHLASPGDQKCISQTPAVGRLALMGSRTQTFVTMTKTISGSLPDGRSEKKVLTEPPEHFRSVFN